MALLKKYQVVAAAKEALRRFRNRTMVPKVANSYYEARSLKDHQSLRLLGRDKQKIQSFVKKTPCNVCALGALFVGKVSKYDGFAFFQNGGASRHARGFLGEEQAHLIEHAFEDGEVCEWNADKNEYDTFLTGNTPGKRLVTILNNIIKNKGIFKPFGDRKRSLE